MNPEELNNIAEVIYNKIYNRNTFIKAYQKGIYSQKLEFDISIEDIKETILNKEDLNWINNIDIQSYLKMDLNSFLSFVLLVRKNSIESYIEYIKTCSMDSFFDWFIQMLECFTKEESITMKKTIINRILNFDLYTIDSMPSEKVDDILLTIFLEMKEQETPKKIKK